MSASAWLVGLAANTTWNFLNLFTGFQEGRNLLIDAGMRLSSDDFGSSATGCLLKFNFTQFSSPSFHNSI